MKNKIKLLFLICLTTILCGCVKYEYTMTLGSDKKFNITIIDSIQKDYSSSLESSFAEAKAVYEQKGYQVENYVDEQYQGIKVYTTFSNIDDLSSSEEMVIELTKLFDQDKDKIKLFTKNKKQNITTYSANFTYDFSLSQEEKDLMKEYNIDEGEYDSTDLEFYYSIVLPKNTKVIENNATKFDEDNNKLSWSLKYGEVTKIKFSFTLDDKDISKNDPDFEYNIQNNNEDNSISNEDNSTSNNVTNQNNNILSSNNTKSENNFGSLILPLLFVAGIVYIFILMKRKLNNKIYLHSNKRIISHQKPPSFKRK